MKRFIIITLVFFSILGTVLFTMERARHKKPVRHMSAGTAFVSFPVGYRNGSLVELSNYTGMSNVVLCFTDKSPNSLKLNAVLEKKLRGFMNNYPKTLWFTLEFDGKNAEISEYNSKIPRYISSLDSLPKEYDFSVMPVIYLIDKTGTIKMIYRGFSPTVINDISAAF